MNSMPGSTCLDLDTLEPDVKDITKEHGFRQRQGSEGQKRNTRHLTFTIGMTFQTIVLHSKCNCAKNPKPQPNPYKYQVLSN